MSVLTYALTTRQRAMDFMGVSSLTTTQENVLDRIIDAVTDFIEKHTGRRFKETVYTEEEYDGDGSKILLLKNLPIDSAASFLLEYRTSAINEDSWETLDSESYFVDYDAGIVHFVSPSFKGRKAYRVTYTAGYEYDNSATFLSSAGAADLEYVAWKLISTAFNKRKGNIGVQSESIGDYSVTYTKAVFEDEEIREILNKYSKIDGVGGPTPDLY